MGRAVMAAAPCLAGRSAPPRVLPALPGGGCPGAHLESLGPPFPTKAFLDLLFLPQFELGAISQKRN